MILRTHIKLALFVGLLGMFAGCAGYWETESTSTAAFIADTAVSETQQPVPIDSTLPADE